MNMKTLVCCTFEKSLYVHNFHINQSFCSEMVDFDGHFFCNSLTLKYLDKIGEYIESAGASRKIFKLK